jgi:hypothetical protein
MYSSLNRGNAVHIIVLYNVSDLDSYICVHFVIHVTVEYCVLMYPVWLILTPFCLVALHGEHW